jgi:hypothetical protein
MIEYDFASLPITDTMHVRKYIESARKYQQRMEEYKKRRSKYAREWQLNHKKKEL